MPTHQGLLTQGPNPEAGPTPEKGNHSGRTWGLDLPLKSNFINAALRSSLERGPEGRGEAAQLTSTRLFSAARTALFRLQRPTLAQETDVRAGARRF